MRRESGPRLEIIGLVRPVCNALARRHQQWPPVAHGLVDEVEKSGLLIARAVHILEHERRHATGPRQELNVIGVGNRRARAR